MPPPVILASSSLYRRELLERLQLGFRAESPELDETPQAGERPEELVARLSRSKALVVARRHCGAVVIGSDQVCTLDGRVLGKPGSEDRARAQLKILSGREVEFLTGVCVARAGGDSSEAGMDVTRVRFRALTDAAIRDYVARERPLDCAGSFKSEGLGISLFERIRSDDPTALIGLPLILVCRLLGRAGVPVLAGP